MNIFFVYDDGSLVTPPLSGTILPGITRDSIMTLARDEGVERAARNAGLRSTSGARTPPAAGCARRSPAVRRRSSRRSARSGARDGEFIVGDGGSGPGHGGAEGRALVGIQRGQQRRRRRMGAQDPVGAQRMISAVSRLESRIREQPQHRAHGRAPFRFRR